MNYPPHRYTEEERAQAVALVRSGMSAARASDELGFPERSVQRWVAEYREMSAKEDDPLLTPGTYRIAQRSTELIEAGLEYMAEQGTETAFKSLFVLNAIRGTSIDKLMGAKRAVGQTGSITINFNVPTSETTPTMEADYREVAPAQLDAPADE